MMVLGIRPSPDGDEQLFFEIIEGTADHRTFAGEDGRKKALGNLAERLRRKLGQEAYDELHLSLYELPPDYFFGYARSRRSNGKSDICDSRR